MSQRRGFIEDATRGLYAMRELCARYGIRGVVRAVMDPAAVQRAA